MDKSGLFLQAVTWVSLPLGSLAMNTRFEQFYPQYGFYFSSIRDAFCESEHSAQRADYTNKTDITGPCPKLYDCILQHTSEEVKGNMASATVLLGLMPTILIFLSSSMTETALLARRRPVLAFLLACGSPAVDPIPSFVYPDPAEYLRPQSRSVLIGNSKMALISRAWVAPFVVVGEYLLALGAVGIAVRAAIDAGRRSISAVACTDDYYPQMWLGYNAMVHVMSVIALYFQAQDVPQEGERPDFRTRIARVVRCELRLCLQQEKMQLRLRDETLGLILFWWFRSLAVVAYFAYGTVAFSSLGFIGYNDAVTILAQFMGAALLCRMVLMFELAGMRLASNRLESLSQEINGQELELNPTYYELREEPQSGEVRAEIPRAMTATGFGRISVNYPGRM